MSSTEVLLLIQDIYADLKTYFDSILAEHSKTQTYSEVVCDQMKADIIKELKEQLLILIRNEFKSDKQTVPTPEIVPKVEITPKEEMTPKVEITPEVETVPKVETTPKSETVPNVETTPSVVTVVSEVTAASGMTAKVETRVTMKLESGVKVSSEDTNRADKPLPASEERKHFQDLKDYCKSCHANIITAHSTTRTVIKDKGNETKDDIIKDLKEQLLVIIRDELKSDKQTEKKLSSKGKQKILP